jgi:hypothetical protein
MTNIEPSTEEVFRCVDTEVTMYRRQTENKSELEGEPPLLIVCSFHLTFPS